MPTDRTDRPLRVVRVPLHPTPGQLLIDLIERLLHIALQGLASRAMR
jgi:hypothetical protein